MDKVIKKFNAYRIRRHIRNNDVDALSDLMTHKKKFIRNMVIETCDEIKLPLDIEQSWLKLLTHVINDSKESFEKIISAAKMMVVLCGYGWEQRIVILISHVLKHPSRLTRFQILEIMSFLEIVRKKGSDQMLKEISDYLYTNLSIHATIGRMLGVIEKDSSTLINYFEKTKDDLIRTHILIALGVVADETAKHFIIEKMSASPWHIKKSVIEGIGETGSPRVIPVLQNLLLENLTDVVVQAIVIHGEDAISITASALLARENAWRVTERMIGLGIPGSEPFLIKILRLSSDPMVARCFLNSGNRRLDDAARNWADNNGYSIKMEHGRKSPNWGSRKREYKFEFPAACSAV